MKSTIYIAKILVCLIGAIPCLKGQEFFKTYSDISTNPSQYWHKIQGIYETNGHGYLIPHITIHDTGFGGLRWMEVDSSGTEIDLQLHYPPAGFNYWFENFHLLEDYDYLRVVLQWPNSSLLLTKYTETNEVIWEKGFSNANYIGFLTTDKQQNVWLLYKADSISGDSLVLNKLTNGGELIWQLKVGGDYDLEVYFPNQLKDNFLTTPTGGIILQNRKYSEQNWGIISVRNNGQLKWVYDTLPGIELYPLAAGANESTLVLEKDANGQESLVKLNPDGHLDWNILVADSTGWVNPIILGAVERNGDDFVLVATVGDTLKAIHIRPDGSFGQRWEQISLDHFFDLGFKFQAGLEDSNGDVLFTGFRSTTSFLARLSPLESFPSDARTVVEEQAAFHLFPNPAREKVTISLPPALDKGNYKMVLMNALGKKVLSQNIQEGETEISVGGVPPGIYFLFVYKNGAIVGAKRLVII